MNITVPGTSFVLGLAALAFAAVTLVMAFRRGYGWVVPARLALSGTASVTANIWTAKLVAHAPSGVLDAQGKAVVAAFAILLVGGLLSPTVRQFRAFFFGEHERY